MINYLLETQAINQALFPLTKTAGITDMLSSGAGTIMQWGKDHVDTSSATSVISSLSDLLVPGLLFEINPIFGILGTIAETLGIKPSSIVKTMFQFVFSKLKNNQEVSMGELNQVGNDAVASEAGPMEDSNQVIASEWYQLLKIAAPPSYPETPIFGSNGKSALSTIISNLLKTKRTGKAKWIVGGIVKWIVKTVLLGAGLIAGGEAIKHVISPNKPTPDATKPEQPIATQTTQQAIQTSPIPETDLPALNPTGNGTTTHPNDEASSWFVPVVNGSIQNTLIAWAAYVYGKLANQEHLLSSLKSFRQTAQTLQANFESATANFQMPTQYKSIKQVVDQFAPEALQKLTLPSKPTGTYL